MDLHEPLVEPLVAVCTADQAIDHAASDLEKYADTRDMKHLRFVPGAHPKVFRLRPIGLHMMTSYVDATPSLAEKYRRAFQVAVERIDNLPDMYGTLRSYAPTQPFRLPDGELIVIADDAMSKLAAILGGHVFVYEMGLLAYERAFLGKALGDGAVSWSLPPSSHAVISRMKLHRAEKTPARSATTSASSSPSGSPLTSEQPSAPPSDAAADPSAGTSVPAG